MRLAVVKAAFDDDGGVWYVKHSDMEGLRIEGGMFEAFRQNVVDGTVDLLEGEADEIVIEIIAHTSVRTHADA